MPPTLNPPSTMSKLFDLFGRLFSDAKSKEILNINSLPDLRGSLGGQVKKIVFS
jgi:hypothetical protein